MPTNGSVEMLAAMSEKPIKHLYETSEPPARIRSAVCGFRATFPAGEPIGADVAETEQNDIKP